MKPQTECKKRGLRCLNLLTDDDSAQAREWSNCQACADVHSPAKAGYPPKRYALAVQSSWITLDALPTTSTPPGGCTHQHRLPATSFRRIYILERTGFRTRSGNAASDRNLFCIINPRGRRTHEIFSFQFQLSFIPLSRGSPLWRPSRGHGGPINGRESPFCVLV